VSHRIWKRQHRGLRCLFSRSDKRNRTGGTAFADYRNALRAGRLRLRLRPVSLTVFRGDAMADKGHQGFAGMDEERQREIASEGGHASHEKGAAHEFSSEEAAEAGRKGSQARVMSGANRESAGSGQSEGGEAGTSAQGGTIQATNGAQSGSAGGTEQRSRRTRGGTHDQHVTAGKKGGSRIRELIELGYKYEEEHGIGPGRNERSKLAAKRRASKAGGGDEGDGGEGD
jgi:uncharacterized protein